MAETVDVLLATFNGALFLPEQLGSIEAQTHRDWRLIVRDDGSTDRTPAIIEEFARRHRDQVRVLQDGGGRLGVRDNFAALLEASDAPYFMFCDQDDVWLPEKVAALLRSIKAIEARRGAETPTLVHSDLVVVDDELRVLHRSYWRRARIFDPSVPSRPQSLIVRGIVCGCGTIGNAALRLAALPIPDEACTHDWWASLVAALLGELRAHGAPTVLYRQHGGNELGAQSRNPLALIRQFVRAPHSTIRQIRDYIRMSQNQAAAFVAIYRRCLDANTYQTLSEFSGLSSRTLWDRKTLLYRRQLWPYYWVPSAIFWLFL